MDGMSWGEKTGRRVMKEKASGQLSGEEAEEEQKGSMTMGQGSSIRNGRRTLPGGNGPSSLCIGRSERVMFGD